MLSCTKLEQEHSKSDFGWWEDNFWNDDDNLEWR